jgi:hypothetical protein
MSIDRSYSLPLSPPQHHRGVSLTSSNRSFIGEEDDALLLPIRKAAHTRTHTHTHTPQQGQTQKGGGGVGVIIEEEEAWYQQIVNSLVYGIINTIACVPGECIYVFAYRSTKYIG